MGTSSLIRSYQTTYPAERLSGCEVLMGEK